VHADVNSKRALGLLGRGSSRHAALFAEHVAAMSGRPIIAQLKPWLVERTPLTDAWKDTAVLAYSASGQSGDVASAAKALRDCGARVIGITNASSKAVPLGDSAHELVLLQAGEEKAVAATKSFTAQLAVSAAMFGEPVKADAHAVAASMDRTLESSCADQIADFLLAARCVTIVARGTLFPVALDGALKLQEVCQTPAAGVSSAELLHGPIAAVGPSDRVLVLSCEAIDDPSRQSVLSSLAHRNVPVLHVSDQPLGDVSNPCTLSVSESRWGAAITFAATLHLAAARLADRKGLDPDRPSGLTKVTQTR
jgi:glutamine---fructose-6-phosphate transaminase (isomerizing)